MPRSYLQHIHACNSLEASSLIPLFIGNTAIAMTHPKAQEAIQHFSESFIETPFGWRFHDSCATAPARTEALESVREHLSAHHVIGPSRHEPYAVTAFWETPSAITVDRSAAAILGIPSFGVHINGYVTRPDGIYMWIGRRSRHKPVAPGKLDNMVAGGQPAHLSLHENIVKESFEEASLPHAIAEQAKLVSLVRYAMAESSGTRFDTLFCYDLELPETVIPTPNDDECEGFTLMHSQDVLECIATGDDFKFNVPLVILDFAIRHGLLTPEATPEYTDIAIGLRRPFPEPFPQTAG